MKIEINKLFNTEVGSRIYENFKRAIVDFSMQEYLNNGVLLGFSGGPDSVMLLCALLKYSEENHYPKKILAVHVNHMIRGKEADADEAFSKEFSDSLGVEFISERIDVPLLAKELSLGLEEAARKARYSAFYDIISGRNDIKIIAVAHNSTDNIETVIFNLLRGTGTNGLAGIKPVRDNVIRPLIYSAKADIISALKETKIPFVTDSTNEESDYTRNYIRHNIIPHFSKVAAGFEKNIQRSCNNLRSDDSFIESEAMKVISKRSEKGLCIDLLRDLHPALLSRVLFLSAKECGVLSLEATHVKKLRDLIYDAKNKDFSVSIPGDLSFISSDGFLYVGKLSKGNRESFSIPLNYGINTLPNSESIILLSEEKIDKTFSNVYKIAIQQRIDFDIIDGGIFVREKRDGDSYRYGGMTHKLKKIFNDKGIKPSERKKIPIICDNSGILWVPGFPVRDKGTENSNKYVYIAIADKIT